MESIGWRNPAIVIALIASCTALLGDVIDVPAWPWNRPPGPSVPEAVTRESLALPEILIQSPGPGHVAAGDVSFYGRIATSPGSGGLRSAVWWVDDGPRAELPVTGGGWHVVWTANGGSGPRVFHVAAVDALGQASTAEREFVLQLLPLEVFVETPAPGQRATGDVMFQGRVAATPEYLRSMTVQWWMDEGAPGPVTLDAADGRWSVLWTAWGADAPHVFHVRVTDAFGRSAHAQRAIEYDAP